MAEKLKCYLCQGDLGDRPEDSWCYDCKRFICEMHSTIFGRHQPEAHDEEGDA